MPRNISHFLEKVVLPEYNWKVKLLENWPNLIGNKNQKVIIERIDNDSLTIGVMHPAWAQEFFLLSDVLKNRINNYLGKNYIKNIRFKIISNNHKNNTSKNLSPNAFYNNKNSLNKTILLTEYEQKSLNKISNQELKDFLKDFYIRCKRGESEKYNIKKDNE